MKLSKCEEAIITKAVQIMARKCRCARREERRKNGDISRLIVKILHFAQYDRKKVMKTDKKEEAAFAKAVQAVAAHCEATDCGHCPYYRTH